MRSRRVRPACFTSATARAYWAADGSRARKRRRKRRSMTDLTIDPKTSALLVMDYQTMIVGNYAGDPNALLGRMAGVIAAARKAKMMVLYVVVGFRKGHPEVSPRNAIFAPLKQGDVFGPGAPGSEIHPQVAPHDGDVVVIKHRVGAFLGTDLDMVLRANGIET